MDEEQREPLAPQLEAETQALRAMRLSLAVLVEVVEEVAAQAAVLVGPVAVPSLAQALAEVGADTAEVERRLAATAVSGVRILLVVESLVGRIQAEQELPVQRVTTEVETEVVVAAVSVPVLLGLEESGVFLAAAAEEEAAQEVSQMAVAAMVLMEPFGFLVGR